MDRSEDPRRALFTRLVRARRDGVSADEHRQIAASLRRSLIFVAVLAVVMALLAGIAAGVGVAVGGVLVMALMWRLLPPPSR